MSAAPTRTAGQERAIDPWERWGILYATVWLGFLAFPVAEAFGRGLPGWRVALAVATIAAFAAVYVAGWIVVGRDAPSAARRTPWVVAVLLVLFAATTAQIEQSTIGMLIFVVVFLALVGTARQASTGIALVLLVAVGTAWLIGGGDSVFQVGLLLLMTLVSVMLRMMETRREDFQRLQEESAVAGERERVARDVHDVLGHSLTVITTKAELAERLLESDPQRAAAELADIRSLGREGLTEIRATVAGLRVARLGDELAHARDALRAAGVAAEVPDDPQVVDPRRRLVLAWVLREAVTNVVRHSGATRCTVELGAHSLVVADDGAGMAASSTPGHGLRGVAERVRAAGAELRLDGAGFDGAGFDAAGLDGAGRGVRLEVRWP